MDRIDELLFKYNNEKEWSRAAKEWFRFVMWPAYILMVLLIFGVIAALLLPRYFGYICLGMLVVLGIIYLWSQLCTGIIGTKKWKRKVIQSSRIRFKENQTWLIECIKMQDMTNQQVYNLLKQKQSRMPQEGDRPMYVLSIASMLLSFTCLLVTPLVNRNYTEYIMYIILILLLLWPVGIMIYKFFKSLRETEDSKFMRKNRYEYIIKLLEDYLN